MGARFLVTFLIALLSTLAALGGAGLAVSRLAVAPPRDLFRAGFFELELSPGWHCELDGSEHVCSPPGKPPHAAIMVIAMKQRKGDMDDLATYEAHLQRPNPGGEAIAGSSGPSQRREPKVLRVGRKTISGHEWVEAHHADSELVGFHTYYLATTTSFLGVLVTLSVREDQAERYIAEMSRMIASLVVYQR